MIHHGGRSGFVLVTVLVITAIGLLFGAGALLMFKFQCQMRIDRQHELEKVYAVRSALNYCRTKGGDIPDAGKVFNCRTKSDRDLKLIVKPADLIFPKDVEKHFFMTNLAKNAHFYTSLREQYYSKTDYEYGASGITNNYSFTEALKYIDISESGTLKGGLAFTDTAATNVKWWVNIGMRDTGGWLQEDYGRRYYFLFYNYLGSATTHEGGKTVYGDITRLCIIRDSENPSRPAGCRRGWPLSMNNERALVLEIQPRRARSEDGKDISSTIMTLSEYRFGDNPKVLLSERFSDALCYMGMQIAQKMITVFYIDKRGGGDPRLRPYTFLEDRSVEMSQDTYEYFAEGMFTNQIGQIKAPDLRAVLEVEACSDLRDGSPVTGNDYEHFTDFRVTPAYQYDVFLNHPSSVTNRATVAQRIITGSYNAFGTANAILTYDTHGTENKGFRKDEKYAREKR